MSPSKPYVMPVVHVEYVLLHTHDLDTCNFRIEVSAAPGLWQHEPPTYDAEISVEEIEEFASHPRWRPPGAVPLHLARWRTITDLYAHGETIEEATARARLLCIQLVEGTEPQPPTATPTRHLRAVK